MAASALPTSWLAIAVALASFAIILLAFAGLALDIRDRRRAELETDRMRGLANAAVEGLIVATATPSRLSTTASRSWPRWPIRKAVGVKLDKYFPDEATRLKLLGRPNQPVEAELRQADGSIIRSSSSCVRSSSPARSSTRSPCGSAGAQEGRAAHPLSRAP